jgi:hypothetical protein
MARLSRTQLENRNADLNDDLAREVEANNRLSGVDRENGRLTREVEGLREENQTLRVQLSQVLPLVVSATVCLSPAFGELSFKGVTDDGRRVLLEATDGLAVVTLDPSDRSLLLVDSEDNVDSVRVDIDQDGKLTRAELRAIKAFRGAVLLARSVSNGQIMGDELDLLAVPNGASNGVAAALVTKS